MRVFVVSTLLLTLVSLAPTAQSGDVRAAIEAANAKFGAAWGSKDAVAMTALYTANATLLPPNGASATGTQAILEFWKAALPGAPAMGKVTTVEVESRGDTAHEVGTHQLSMPDGKVADKGSIVVIWKREGGQWKLHRDIWNSDLPTAGM